jgi:transcriptional regulator with XRE-family HTH domain
MAEKRRRPGSPKGQPKPAKRLLDQGFPERFAKALGTLSVPDLASKVHCSRAVLHKYLNGKSKTIEALLLFSIADELGVEARQLATGKEGLPLPVAQREKSTIEEIMLHLFGALVPLQQREIIKEMRALFDANQVIRKQMGGTPLRSVSNDDVERAFGAAPAPKPKPKRPQKTRRASDEHLGDPDVE